jgi:hypothetical protein
MAGSVFGKAHVRLIALEAIADSNDPPATARRFAATAEQNA